MINSSASPGEHGPRTPAHHCPQRSDLGDLNNISDLQHNDTTALLALSVIVPGDEAGISDE